MSTPRFISERAAVEPMVQAKFASVPVAFENVPFIQPQASAWARCTIMSGRGYRVDTSNWNRFAGIVQIDVFVPADTGQVEGRNLADAAASIFRDKQVTQGQVVMTFGSPSFRIMDGAKADGWFHIVVEAPFTRDSKGPAHVVFQLHS